MVSHLADATMRPHHYLFAHRALRDLFQDQPSAIMDILHRGQRAEFLSQLWNTVADSFGTRDEVPLDVYTAEAFDARVAAVVLPQPSAIGEAFMVGMIVRGEPGEGDRAWYFTLELGTQQDYRTPRTVLGRWRQNTHVSYGDGPTPHPETFLQLLLHLTD